MKLTIWGLLALLPALAAAWTKEDHEIFRLKDELDSIEGPEVTFYDYLGISASASQDDIAKAYRKKGKAMHPDKAKQAYIAGRVHSASKKARASARSASAKAKAEGRSTTLTQPPKPSVVHEPSERELRAVRKKATEDFTRLGLINRILQGPERERYDYFLANGFPAWRGTGYYYSRYRPGGGTVILGLFIFAGGAMHYVVLIVGWKRQRDFVQRYIAQAQTLAWGNNRPVANIPGLDIPGESTAASSAVAAVDDAATGEAGPTLTRRERRAQEKAKKKPSAKDRAQGQGTDSGTATPTSRPAENLGAGAAGTVGPVPGPRKRVQAENGKTLVVDSVGNVFLEETVHEEDADSDDEGETQLLLLDANEVLRPTVRDTMVFRLPAWIYATAKRRVLGADGDAADDDGDDVPGDASQRRRKKVPRKPPPGTIGNVDPASAPAAAPASAAAASTASLATGGASSGDDEVDGFVAVGDRIPLATGELPESGGGKKKKNNKGKKGR